MGWICANFSKIRNCSLLAGRLSLGITTNGAPIAVDGQAYQAGLLRQLRNAGMQSSKRCGMLVTRRQGGGNGGDGVSANHDF